jgi:hypothetical protein
LSRVLASNACNGSSVTDGTQKRTAFDFAQSPCYTSLLRKVILTKVALNIYQKKWLQQLEIMCVNCSININRRAQDARDVRRKGGRNSFNPCNQNRPTD